MLRKIFIILSIFLLLLLTGCTINNVKFNEQKVSGSLESNELLAAEGYVVQNDEVLTTQLIVQNRNGSIKIEKWTENFIKVDYEKKANSFIGEDLKSYLEKTSVELINSEDSVAITTNVPRINSGGVSVSMVIYVPKYVDLDITTSNGSITINQGIVGDATLKSSNGGINIDGLKGKFDLDTSNGSIKINNIEGNGRVQTSNGSIYLKSDLDVGNVMLKTSNGKIDMDLLNPTGYEYQVRTSNGTINVNLPEDMGFNLKASTSSGSIKSDFDIDKGKYVEEEVNGGGFKLDIETSNGTINLNSK